MRFFTLLLIGSGILAVGCASTPKPLDAIANLPDFAFPVSLEKLKAVSIQHAETKFQSDLKDRRVDPEEVSLRDHAFRYEGKTRPPLAYEVRQPWLAEKEFGKKEIESSVSGPVDIVVENPKRFVLFCRNTAYLGEKLSENKSRLTVLQTRPFDTAIEEVRPKDPSSRKPLYFRTLVLDVDRALKEASRNRIAEWEILNSVDPSQAKELGSALGVGG